MCAPDPCCLLFQSRQERSVSSASTTLPTPASCPAATHTSAAPVLGMSSKTRPSALCADGRLRRWLSHLQRRLEKAPEEMGPGSEPGPCKRRNLCLDVGQRTWSQATKLDLGSASLISLEGGSVTLSSATSSGEVDMAKRNLSGHFGKPPV